MNNPLHEIDKLFRDGIENRSEYPAKNVWDNIESELERETATRYKRKYNSLKRKASVLLILFLGVVAYLAVSLSVKKGPGKDSGQTGVVNKPEQSPLKIAVATSLPTSEIEKINHQNKTVLQNSGAPEAQQTQRLNGEGQVNEFNDFQLTGSQGQTKVFQVNEITLNTQASLKEDVEKENEVFLNSNEAGSAIRDPKGYEFARLNPILSFSKITNDDLRTKEVAASVKSTMPFNVTDYAIAKNSGRRSSDNSRFSFSASISPNIAWTTLKDDGNQWRNRSGNNNGGSNGGNNNPPNSGGNNNGGNSGGNNGGNNNGGNNGGNNNGGSNGNGWGRGSRGDNRHEIKQAESENLAYSGEVKVSYKVTKRVSVQTGLSYMVSSTDVDPKLIYAGKDRHGDVGYRINCSSGYTFLKPEGSSSPSVGDSIFVNDTRNSVSYLGVPVIVEYKILSAGKFSLSASAGAQVNFLTSGKTTTVFGKGTANETSASSKTEGLKNAYLSAVTNLTAEMRLKNNLSLTLAPVGQFGVSYMNKETSVKTRTNYVGVAAGLKLRL